MGGPGGRPGGAGAGGQNTTRAAGGQSGRAAETLSPPRPLWYLENGKPEVILVRTGISNGSLTEIRAIGSDRENASGEGSLEGMQVILRERVK
jgi:hypothetical protein